MSAQGLIGTDAAGSGSPVCLIASCVATQRPPPALSPLIVEAALRVGDTILLEASLSFLGLGVQPPTASWGNLIADGRASLLDSWWIATLPGVAIALTVIALHMLGDAARERLAVGERS